MERFFSPSFCLLKDNRWWRGHAVQLPHVTILSNMVTLRRIQPLFFLLFVLPIALWLKLFLIAERKRFRCQISEPLVRQFWDHLLVKKSQHTLTTTAQPLIKMCHSPFFFSPAGVVQQPITLHVTWKRASEIFNIQPLLSINVSSSGGAKGNLCNNTYHTCSTFGNYTHG